jgi:hypothetical protein
LVPPLSTASKHTLHDTNSPTPRAESEALPILRRSYEPRNHAKRYRERKSPRGATAPCLLPRGGLHHRAVIRPSLSRQSKMMLEAHRSRSRLRGLFGATTSAPRRALLGFNSPPHCAPVRRAGRLPNPDVTSGTWSNGNMGWGTLPGATDPSSSRRPQGSRSAQISGGPHP